MKTQFWQDAGEWAQLHPEKPLSDFIKEEAHNIPLAGLSGMLGGAAQGAVVHTVRTVGNTVLNRTVQAEQQSSNANIYADGMNQMTDVIKSGKLSARSPEAVADFINHIAPDETVHIDAKDFNGVLQQRGINPEDFVQQLPSIKDTYATATQTDGILSMPVSEYLTAVGKSEVAAEMNQHVRQTPESLSAAEATTAKPELQEQIIQEAMASVEQITADTPVQEAAVAIERALTAQQAAVASRREVEGKLTGEMQQATPEMTAADIKMNARLIAQQYAQLASLYPGEDRQGHHADGQPIGRSWRGRAVAAN